LPLLCGFARRLDMRTRVHYHDTQA
jgi:hypothetical protein